jgi:predicted molibdopterin-dependent oxidoreductase YjgC
MISIVVDDREIFVEEGKNLLQACLDEGIYIPNLCFMVGMENPPGSCRLCFVEINHQERPVSACRTRTAAGMVVRTDSSAVRRLQRAAFRLLRSAHRIDCRNCPSNRRCELQRLARFLTVPLKPKRLDHLVRECSRAEEHPFFDYDPSKCVLCGRCVYICRKLHGHALLTFARRGFQTVVSSFGADNPSALPCKDCRACVDVCPVSAIFLKEDAQPKPSCEANS